MSKREEKKLYKQLEQQVAAAYENASEADKKRIDALRKTIYNYQGADPMTNRDARRLHIDGYQRMLDMATGGKGYDPTRLGTATTNEWGYYSPDEITNIGNQLAYTLFHDRQPQQGSTTVVSNSNGNNEGSANNSDWNHTNFVWNKGMIGPDYFTSSMSKTQKAGYFISGLQENLKDALEKSSTKIVHGLNDLKVEDIPQEIQMLESYKNLNWDTPSVDTEKAFEKIARLASLLKIDPSEMAYYFDIDGSTLTDPVAQEGATILKELKLREVDKTGIDQGALSHLKNNNWQLLADEDGVVRVYDSEYKLAPAYGYLSDDPTSSDYKQGFFVNQNGQYLYIPNIEEYTDWNNQDFGPMVGSAVEAIKQARNWNNMGTYDPYHKYVNNSDSKDTSMQELMDKISQKLQSTNFQFVDMSGYFRGNEAVIGVPTEGQITKDYFGNLQFDPNMMVYKLDTNGNLIPMTFQQASAQGYHYAGYDNENMAQYHTYDTRSVLGDFNNPDIVNFNMGDNRWGLNGIERAIHAYGKDSTKEIDLNTAVAWANEVLHMILTPQEKKQFNNKHLRHIEVLEEMGYNPSNPLLFVQGLYAFLQQYDLLDKINQSDMKKVLEFVQNAQAVPSAQMGTVLDYNNKKYTHKNEPSLPERLTEDNSSKTETGELSGVALTRMISLGVDLVSLVSAFCPGAGTVVSAATGVGSSFANFGADIAEDGFDGGDVGKLLLNIGLDAVGLVGGTGKIPKILRTIGTLFPTLWGAAGLMSNGDQFREILQKTQRGQTLSLQDWQLLAQGVQVIVAGTRGAKNMARSKKIEKLQSIKNSGVSSEAKYVIKGVDSTGNETDVTLTKTQVEKIASAKAQAEVKGTKKKPGTPAKTGYEAANEELHKIPEYKDINLVQGTERKYLVKKVQSDGNPLHGFDFSNPDIPSISQATYDDAVRQLLKHRRGFLFNRNGIIGLPAKKDGGKLNRLQNYINQK